jgi:hypothetical protein
VEHARIFSASQLDRLFACPGSAVLTVEIPRTSTQYSAWGTACHAVAAEALADGDKVYAELLGTKITADDFEFDVDAEMVEVARVYTDYVRDVAGPDGTILVEQRVEFGPHVGLPPEHEGFGTADALVIRGSELIVVDLKTGRGVEVDADSSQLKAYAIGCLTIAEEVADIERVRLVIVQPRNGGVKEHDLWVDDLRAWAREQAAPACRRVLQAVADFSVGHLNPGEEQCRFCPAKATCPALRDAVADTVLGTTPASPDEFAEAYVSAPDEHTPEDWLAAALARVDLIEDWCAAVRAEAHRRLADGLPVPGFKLVPGKRGARAWTDATAAEELLRKKFRLTTEQAYDLKLISPTSAEKLAKAGALGPRQWASLQELVYQPSGKPNVAPDSDPRPAIVVRAVAEEFPTVAASPTT